VTYVVHHAALALAVAALVAAGFRVASLAAPTGVERAIAALVLAAAAAVLEALGLGLVSLGGSAVALVVAALATWGVARIATPAPEVSGSAELAGWARGLRAGELLTLGAVGGAWVAWTAWVAVHPALGHDMIVYHLPEAVSWVHDGQPGSVVSVLAPLPVGNYPLVHEVLFEWGMAIGRSFAWPTLVTAAVPALVGLSAWAGLRALGVGRTAACLGAAALVATPAVLASQRGGSAVDPAALWYLVSAAALVAGARERPGLVAPAVVAAGLAVGCKASTVPLACAVVVLGLLAARAHLRRLAPWLGAAGAVALVTGAFWYVRDLVSHGSPLWPLQSTPWSDPRPPFVDLTATRFVDRPGETLSRLWPHYRAHFGGPLILLAGALAAALLARRRAVAAATAATALCVAAWTAAPLTGLPALPGLDEGAADATRYLLPAVASAVLAIALASRLPRLRVGALALMGGAAAVGLWQTFRLDFPSAPSALVPLAGSHAGAAAALVTLRVPRPPRHAFAVASFAVATAAGAAIAQGFVQRHADTRIPEARVAGWIVHQPEWRDGSAPVLSTLSLDAPLAGDRLQHRLTLVGPRAACRRAAAARGWLVLDLATQRAAREGTCGPPAYEDDQSAVYAPRRGASARAITSPRRAMRGPARRAPRRAGRDPARAAPGAAATAPGARTRSS
jgi:hypothetical protein